MENTENDKKTKKTKKNNQAPKEKMNLYIVDTIVTFRHRYVIEAKELIHAYDEIIMKESGNEDDYFEEATQKCIGETILDGREISKKEFKEMLKDLEHDKDEMSSYWLGEKLIRKINYIK